MNISYEQYIEELRGVLEDLNKLDREELELWCMQTYHLGRSYHAFLAVTNLVNDARNYVGPFPTQILSGFQKEKMLGVQTKIKEMSDIRSRNRLEKN